MAKRATKYDYLYVLQGNYGYGHGYEDLTATPKTFQGLREIKAHLREYRINEGGNYRIIQRRERKPGHSADR